MRNHTYGTWRGETLTATGLIRETFHGLGGNDEFLFYRGTYTGRSTTGDPDFSDRFLGGWGDDRLSNLSLVFYDDSDYDAYAQASFDGGQGIDSINFDVTLSQRAVNALALGRFAAQTRSVEIREFDISATATTQYTSTVNITGNGSNETVRLNFQGMGEANVNLWMGNGNDRVEYTADQDVDATVHIYTGNGADTVIINSVPTTNANVDGAYIHTGNGWDTIVLEGMHSETVYAGNGSDRIYLLSGSFADAPDLVFTGSGNDRVHVELDAYSQLAEIRWFSAAHDVIVFDSADTRLANVVFDAADWDTGATPNLYMNNAAGELYFGNNLLIDFGGPTNLTAANFTDEFWTI